MSELYTGIVDNRGKKIEKVDEVVETLKNMGIENKVFELKIPNIKPLHDFIILQPYFKEKVTSTGIIRGIQDEKTSEGVVVGVGTSDLCKESGLKVEDEVLYTQYSGETYVIDGVEYIMLEVGSIVAVKTEGAKDAEESNKA